MLSDIKNLLFLLTNFRLQELIIMYRIIIITIQNLIIIAKVFEALHVFVVLERQNLLEIR